MKKLALKLRVFQWAAEYGKPFDIDASEVNLDENQELAVKYVLTDFGKGRIKHISS